jgi:hypothetical protein
MCFFVLFFKIAGVGIYSGPRDWLFLSVDLNSTDMKVGLC